MSLQIPDILSNWDMSTVSDAKYYVTGAVAALTLISIMTRRKSPLSKLPTVGSSNWLVSWLDGIRFLQNASGIIQEGYDKYKGTPFKVSTVLGWIVIISGRRQVEEFCKFREDELNLTEAINEVLKLEESFETESDGHPYHISVLRAKLNRNLAPLYADMHDEIVAAFDDQLDLRDHEWKSVAPLRVLQQVVSRASNRMLVGLPLCRVPEWVQLNIDFAMNIFKTATVITLFPKFMTPLVMLFMTGAHENTKCAVRLATPLIEARRKQIAAHGPSWADKPNDYLSWLLDGSQGPHRASIDLTKDILGINFAAIHTTSQAFTLALYNLACIPEYVKVLREEVDPIVREEGWTKASLSRMHKVDSFMKETKRMALPGFTSLLRKAIKDVTLSDGTVIPKGTFVAPATEAIQRDEEFYNNARTFDPLRFANMRTGEEIDDAVKCQFPATNTEYLPFGHGRNACPGRFFAASLLNSMMAHIVVSYDVKLENGGVPGIGAGAGLSETARILFRKRTA